MDSEVSTKDAPLLSLGPSILHPFSSLGICTDERWTCSEFHGYGMYFFAYEWLVQRELQGTVGKTRRDLPVSSAIMYGMGAGYAMWLTSVLSLPSPSTNTDDCESRDYPLDVIKSRMQTDGLPSQAGTPHRKYSSARDCARQLWREQGWKGFFRGLTPTLIRYVCVSLCVWERGLMRTGTDLHS